jgi:DNA-binding transcriptional LysR family regulator
MDIRNLRYLVAIRDHGSFAKAALALSVSQPSLSSAIGRLEDRLRVKLFERTAAGSTITPLGAFIAERATTVIDEVERLRRAAALAAGGDTGTIRIGIGAAVREVHAAGLLVELAALKPDLRITTHVGTSDVLLDLLRARELDLAICGQIDMDLSRGLVAAPLFTMVPIAVASPHHPLAQERGISRRRFAQFPSAGTRASGVSNAMMLGLAEEFGDFHRYDSNDFNALLPLAIAGCATLIVPPEIAKPHIDAGALVPLDVDIGFEVPFVAVTTQVNSDAPIVRQIIGLARALGGGGAPGRVQEKGPPPSERPSASIPA